MTSSSSSSLILFGYTSPLLTSVHDALQDRLEQCYRHVRRLVRPFRYWNFLRVLKIAHHGLALYGLALFWLSNRCITTSTRPYDRHVGTLAASFFFRTTPTTWKQAGQQFAWLAYTVFLGGFPFYAVRHPIRPSWFRSYIHPVIYWGFLGVYKCVWSTWHTVRIADFLTDPRRNPPATTSLALPRAYTNLWRSVQRERIVTFDNLRYQHQWSKIIQELHNTENQRLVKAVRINNRWVALAGFGAAVQDVIDDTLDRHLMRPARVCMFFQRLGQAFPHLQEVSISMTLNLPLAAIAQLLEFAPHLRYLRLDGVALSVHDLQPDLLEFGRSLHGVGSQRDRCLPLQTLLLEDCRLENDEADPQLRTRYSMDLLLAPAIYTALTPPTRLYLKHLRLWVQCQRISALELAVMLGQNTTLTTLDLHLTRDNSNDVGDNNDQEQHDQDEDPVEWIILPLAQVLQHRNTTLEHLSIQLPTTVPFKSLSHKALCQMMQGNETLQTVHLIRTDTQARIRIRDMDFYLHCNRLGRQQFRLDCQRSHYLAQEWVDMLIQQKRHTAVIYYFLQIMDPAILLGMKSSGGGSDDDDGTTATTTATTSAAMAQKQQQQQQQQQRKKSLRKAWQRIQAKTHWATALAYDSKK